MNKYFKLLTMLVCALCIGVYFACSSGSDDKDGGNSGGNNNGGGGSSQPTQSEDIGSFINTNPTDPLQLKLTNSKGEMAMLFGSKDATGAPIDVEYMVVKNAGESENTYLYMDGNQMLEKVIAPNGVVMSFEWLSGTKAAVTLVDPNTNEQLNTVVDFENKDQAAAPAINYNAPKRSGETKMTLTPTKENIFDGTAPTMEITRSSKGFAGNIFVTACGGPAYVDTGVYVEVWDAIVGGNSMPSKTNYRTVLKCYPVTKGQYKFQIPDNYMKNEDMSQLCSKIESILGKICFANAYTLPGSGAKEYLCIAISAAIATAGVGISAPVAAAFGKACLAATISLDTACALMNGGVPIPDEMGNPETGIESLAAKLCKILKEVDAQYEGLYIQPIINDKKYNGQWLIDGWSYSDTNIDLGGLPTIESFTLNPPAPAANQGYEAIAKLTCMTAGTKIVMDIVGTDGYSKSETTEVPATTTGEFTATMHVPGSYEGVLDVVTINVTTPEGQTLTKKASLVFGK